jgi:hypothetical protein
MTAQKIPTISMFMVTVNDDAGVNSYTFFEESEADEFHKNWVSKKYERFFGKELTGDPQEAYEKLCNKSNFMDTIDNETLEFSVSWVTGIYSVLHEISLSNSLLPEEKGKIQEALMKVPIVEAPVGK